MLLKIGELLAARVVCFPLIMQSGLLASCHQGQHSRKRAVVDMRFGKMLSARSQRLVRVQISNNSKIGLMMWTMKMSPSDFVQMEVPFIQYIQRVQWTNARCVKAGLLTSNMEYLCRHVFVALQLPLSIDGFNRHWWLVHPSKVVVQQGLLDLPPA